jgi:hypothetical protein
MGGSSPPAYPAYFGTYYGEFGEIRAYMDRFSNLYPVGRNGMHRYNNQYHSMLAADSAASSMISGGVGREIWHINAEYHEEIDGPPKIATQVTPSRLCFTHRGLESTVIMTCLGT